MALHTWNVSDFNSEAASIEFNAYNRTWQVKLTKRKNSSFPFDVHVVNLSGSDIDFTYEIIAEDPATETICYYERTYYTTIQRDQSLDWDTKKSREIEEMTFENNNSGRCWKILIQIWPGDADYFMCLEDEEYLKAVDITNYPEPYLEPAAACTSSSPDEAKSDERSSMNEGTKYEHASSLPKEENNREDSSTQNEEVVQNIPEHESKHSGRSERVQSSKSFVYLFRGFYYLCAMFIVLSLVTFTVSLSTCVWLGSRPCSCSSEMETPVCSSNTQTVISHEALDAMSKTNQILAANDEVLTGAAVGEKPDNWDLFVSSVGSELKQLKSPTNRISTKREIWKLLVAASEKEDV